MKIILIFVLIIISSYANTNFKTPLARCNTVLKTTIDNPSCQGAFNFMKLIPLSKKSKKNAGKYFAMVDDDMFDYLNQWSWYAIKSGKLYYASRSAYIETVNGKHIYKNILMSRLILGITDKSILCDHIDRDSLNNQRSNLRIATKSQNAINCHKRPNKTSKYIGVSANKFNRWSAYITLNQKGYNLGSFKTEEEAAQAYDAKAKEFHGEFANLNFKE